MIKLIKGLFKFIFTILIVFFAFAYIFSIKTGIPLENTIAYFKSAIISNNNIENSVSDDNTIIVELTDPSTYSNKYYYKQLDDTSKIIYDALEKNIDNLKKDNYVINFEFEFNDLLKTSSGNYILNRSFQTALDAFMYEHPELFYIDLTKISLYTTYVSLGPIKTYTVKIGPADNQNYLSSSFKSEYEVNKAISKVESIKDNIVNTALKEKDTYSKIKKVHDLLVNSIEYDTSLSKEHIYDIYGALVNKKSVCEGYAKAFKYILDSLNIECILVSGLASNSSNETSNHMWNYVKLNNVWYGIDLTWDDPIIIGSSNKNTLRHDYFLKGYNIFIESHTPNGKISETGMLFTLPSLAYRNYK